MVSTLSHLWSSPSGAVSAVSAAVLLFESRSLRTVVKPRNRRVLFLQLRLVVLLIGIRRLVESLAELKGPRQVLAKQVPSLYALATQLLDFLRRPLGAALTGAVVPLGLAASGLSLVLANPAQHFQRVRWLRRVLAYGSVPTLADAIQERFGEEVDVIAVLALELGLLMGEMGASSVILLMLTGGEALEHYTFSRARASLAGVMDESTPVVHRLPKSSQQAFFSTGKRKAPIVADGKEEEPFSPGKRKVPTAADGKEEECALSDDESEGDAKELEIRSGEIDIEDINADEIEQGDVLAVRSGEMIAVDGVCIPVPGSKKSRKPSYVVDSLLTGEAGQKMKRTDDDLLSGSIAKTPLWMRAKATYEGSTLELMRRSLQDALERKGQVQHHSARAASLLQPLTLAAAALSVALRKHQSPHRRWTVALSVLMAATPCPASLGVPVAYLSGMSVAARHSVLIKSGAAIEAAALATHVVLDKTGTLTMGAPQVLSFEVDGDGRAKTTNRALQLLVSIEVLSSHSLALALCRYATEQGVAPLRAVGTESHTGWGMLGTVDGHRVGVGTLGFLREKGFPGAGAAEVPKSGDDLGALAVMETHFAIEGLCTGRATFEDALRPGTASAVRQLQNLGLHVSILSGDHSAHLNAVAQQVGVVDVQGALLPHEKAKQLKEIARRSDSNRIIMVGDESNDAPALAAAHVGIAVGTQSGLASQSADVVVGSDASATPLLRVAQLVILCRVIVRTASRGVRVGLGLSALQVVAAAAGLLPPRTNAILQEIVDVSALMNAAAVLRHRFAF